MDPVLSQMSEEPGDLDDGNMSGHLVDRPAPVHLPQTKNSKRIFLSLHVGQIMFLNLDHGQKVLNLFQNHVKTKKKSLLYV